MTAGPTHPICLQVSEDRLRVTLVPGRNDPAQFTAEAVVAALRELSIQLPEGFAARVEGMLSKVQPESSAPVVLIEGRAPVAGVGATFTLSLSSDTEEAAEGQSDWHRSSVLTAAAGECIGTLTPSVAAVDGCDVFGKPIPAPSAGAPVRLGKNVRLDADGRRVIATAAGKVCLAHGELSIVELVEIGGDVDYSTGNVHAPSDIVIKGTVRESFEVTGKRSVSINGAIEAATVQAGTDVYVGGGITAQGKGRVVAGGAITAKFCNAADLRAGGDVTIRSEACNNRIHAAGRLDVAGGALLGGYAYARGGASVKELGNEANIPTEIAIGADPVVLAEADEAQKAVKKLRETIETIRQKVGPLMAMVKHLSPQQRERATELLCQADELEMKADEMQKKRDAAAAATSFDTWPALEVRGHAYPRVTLIFGNKETTLTREHRGPIKFVRRLMDNVEEIVIVDQISGSVTILPSRAHRPKPATQEPAK